jgi:hypothetical protein
MRSQSRKTGSLLSSTLPLTAIFGIGQEGSSATCEPLGVAGYRRRDTIGA